MVNDKKEKYVEKLEVLLGKYNQILLVGVDFVGSKQIQDIRARLRGQAEILMGKNTMIRRILRTPKYYNRFGSMLPYVEGNIGFIFTNGDLSELKKILGEMTVAAPAKAGVIAPDDVIVPKGDTGLEPTQTATMQRLNIATRINKGQIMILNDTTLITKGEKVGASEALLLKKLKILPFRYGLVPQDVYDNGSIYPASVLDLTAQDMEQKVLNAVANIASVSLHIGLPNTATIRHSLSRGFKNLISVSVATEIVFKQSEEIKNILENPEAFAAVAATSAPAAGGEAASEKPAEEEEEEEEEEMGFSLFD